MSHDEPAMSEPSTSTYLHGSSPGEQARLALMNDILNGRELSELALRGDERVLDVGAGTGVFAVTVARALPDGSVLAIERDERQLESARRNTASVANVELRAGDAYALPLTKEEQGTFDLVHARFLLEHLERPLEAVQAMVAACRPGGRIVLVDDDHSLMRAWPEPPGFWELWNVYVGQFEELGMDPYVGRRLVSLLHEAGARPRRVSAIFYGGCSNDPGFAPIVENLVRVVESAGDRIVASGELTRERFDAALDAVREWGRGEDRALWYVLPYAEGTR